jgi:hypothetical protein
VVGCWVGVLGARARAARLMETPTAGVRDPESRPD